MRGLPNWASAMMRRDNDRRSRANILIIHALSALEVGDCAGASRRLHQARIHTGLRARGEPIGDHWLEYFRERKVLLSLAAEYHREPAATSREERR